jgi:hypothetical protein
MRASHLLLASALLIPGLLASCASGPEEPAEQAAAVTAPIARRLVVTVKLARYAEEMVTLTGREYDVAGVDVTTGEVDVVVDDSELEQLRREGWNITRVLDPGSLAPDPDLNRYLRSDTLATALRARADQHPSLAEVTSIGRSNAGRDILAVRITKDVHAVPSVPKPTILFNSMHHARELMTAEVGLDTVDYLLEHYGKDAKVTHWVDANEIWVIPMLNVDGNDKVWTDDKFWRKNARGCPATGACRSGTGVDINRNYPYKWGACNGASSNAQAEDYRGPSAGSEPETQAMIRLVDQTRPVFDISYHSYSEVVLYPYGCSGVHAEARAMFEDIGGKLAAALPSDDGVHTYKPGTPWELLYGVDGDDIDWMLHDYGVAPFGIELGSRAQGFQPSYGQWRDTMVVRTRAAWQLLLDRLDGSAVRGFVHTATGELVAGAEVDVDGATRPVNPNGTFHVVLLPGEHDVRVSAPGHTPFARHVSLADARVDLDVILP